MSQSSEAYLKRLEQAIENFDVDAARQAAREALDAGIDPMLAIEDAAKVVREVGDKFQKGELFLPHLVLAGDAMSGAIKILETAIPQEKAKTFRRGTIVLGTVKGDIHDIGKNIVGAILTAEGFEVKDIGKDAPPELFRTKAEEFNADIIAASALMTITRQAQRELVEELVATGVRNKFKVLVGGGTVTAEWAKTIGADGYGKDAMQAAEVAKTLLAARG